MLEHVYTRISQHARWSDSFRSNRTPQSMIEVSAKPVLSRSGISAHVACSQDDLVLSEQVAIVVSTSVFYALMCSTTPAIM